MKRTVSFGNVLSLRRWHGLRRGSGFLWPDRAVSFFGEGIYKGNSGTWYGLEVFELADGHTWYYPYQSGPAPNSWAKFDALWTNFVSFTGNVGAQGVGRNAMVFPIVYDKVRDDQFATWLATH